MEWHEISLRHRNAIMRGFFGKDGAEEPSKDVFTGKSDLDFLMLPAVGRGAMNEFAAWLGREDLAIPERPPGRPRHESERTALYRCFAADGVLLYVGISLREWERVMAHSSRDWFRDVRRIELEHFDSRSGARSAELNAIRTENPRFNIEGKRP